MNQPKRAWKTLAATHMMSLDAFADAENNIEKVRVINYETHQECVMTWEQWSAFSGMIGRTVAAVIVEVMAGKEAKWLPL